MNKEKKNSSFDLSFYAENFGAGVSCAKNRRISCLISHRQQHHQHRDLVPVPSEPPESGARQRWTEFTAFQASSARPKGHKSQEWKTGVRNKTLGF